MTTVAAMARGGSGLAYPERFYAASTYAGFGGSPNSAAKGVASKFSNDTALLLYALYQQVFAYPYWFFLCHTFYRPSFAWARSCLVKSFNSVDPFVCSIIHMKIIIVLLANFSAIFKISFGLFGCSSWSGCVQKEVWDLLSNFWIFDQQVICEISCILTL